MQPTTQTRQPSNGVHRHDAAQGHQEDAAAAGAVAGGLAALATTGYVIVRNAVAADNVERLKDLLWQFDEKDPERSFDLVHAAAARPHHEGAQRHRHGGDLQPPVPLG